ncbi:hypothetical protein RhiirA1_465141 [Rhizophagus irregularis]|uniref:Uncharacterized protein n=1 Tax=Rhizophagus irregularis TaxID=588596 RepID=A0A2I1F9J1_9GLOM|nr:hypothetical protein RhiirA1_465141 [Rhizophagus irregularis]PKY31049.1 hypothetical protein RhiirB3_448447 [Rhizophagus irregularis]
MLKDKNSNQTIKYNFELVDEALMTNEYNLIWNDRIITGGYRKDDRCIRCGKNEIESWEHIWICEDNEFSIDEIVQGSIYRFEQQLKTCNQEEDISILRNFNIEFISILESPSIILRGKSRKWELEALWIFIYDEIKNRLSIPRCEEIKRLEEKANIQKLDLKKTRRKCSNVRKINRFNYGRE